MALEQSGQLLPAEQRAVAMSTRAAKGEGALQTAGDLDRAWWQDAREHAFDARSVEALRGRGQAVDVAEPEPGDELERRIVHRLTEFDATFAQREARAVALEAAAGHVEPDRALVLLERLRERREILELVDGRETTRSHRGSERAALTSARALTDTPAEPIGPGSWRRSSQSCGLSWRSAAPSSPPSRSRRSGWHAQAGGWWWWWGRPGRGRAPR